MSGTVDNRIVQMEFDNKRFESNVKQSLSTLDKLKAALNFKENIDDLKDLQSASDSLNLSHISNAIDKISDKFTLMGQIGFRAMGKIADAAVNAGEKMLKSVFVDQISAGMSKYEAETNAVQTMMASLKDKGKSLQDVYGVLEKLQDYADETSYSYAQMTDGMSKFIASGVDMDVAEKSMEGIANLAAASGVGIHDTAIVFRNFADAISAGSFRLKDYMSLQNAHVDTEPFRQEVIKTAQALGKLDKEGYVLDKTGKRVSKEAVTLKNFTTMLNEGFFDTDVILKVMDQYADRTSDIGKTAFAAAQNAKTFTDVLDAVKDAASTGWSKSFRLIFGDLNEAIALFTPMANKMIEVVNQFDDYRNNLLQGWRDLGGREDLIAALSNIWDLFTDVKDWIGKAGSFVWGSASDNPLINSNILKNVSEKFKNATQSVKGWLHDVDPVSGAGRMQKLFYSFRGAFSVVDAIRQVLGGVKTFAKNIFGQLVPSFDAFLSLTSTIGNIVYRAVEKMKAAGTITKIANGLANAFKPITSRIPNLIRGIQGLVLKFDKFTRTSKSWQKFTSTISNGFWKILEFLPKVTEGIFTFGKSIVDSVKNSGAWAKIKESFSKYIVPLGPKLMAAGKKVLESLKSFFTFDTSGIDGAKNKIIARLKAFWSGISGSLTSGWNAFKGKHQIVATVSNWISGIVSGISSLFGGGGGSGKLGSFNIGEKLKEFIFPSKGRSRKRLDPSTFIASAGISDLKPAVNKIKQATKPFTDTVTNWLKNLSVNDPSKEKKTSTFWEIISGIFTRIKNYISKVTSQISQVLRIFTRSSSSVKKVSNAAKPIWDGIKKAIKAITPPEDVTTAASKAGKKTTGSVFGAIFSQFGETISNAFKAFVDYVKKIDFNQVFSVLKEVLKLYAEFKKIRLIGKLGKTTDKVGNFFTSLQNLFQKGGLKSLWSGSGEKSGSKIKSFVIGVIAVAGALVLAAIALKTLADMEWGDFLNGMLKASAILVAMGTFMVVVNKASHRKGEGGEQMAVNLGSIIGVVAAIWVMSKIISGLAKADDGNWWAGYLKAAAIMGIIAAFYLVADGLAGLMQKGGDNKLQTAPMLGLVAAIWLMGKVIGSLADANDGEWWAGYWKAAAIMGIIAAFYLVADGLTGMMKKGAKSTISTGSLIGLAISIKTMSLVIGSLAKMDDGAFINGGLKALAILTMIAAFYVAVEGLGGKLRGEKASNILTTASLTAIIVFIKAMQSVISDLAKTDDGEFINGAIKLGVIVVAASILMLAMSALIGAIAKAEISSFKALAKKLAIVGVAMLAVAGLMFVFASLANKVDGVDPLSMLAFAAGVAVLGLVMAVVATSMSAIVATRSTAWSSVLKKMAMMGTAMLVVAGIMTVFALLAHKTQGLDPVNMMAFAVSVGVMSLVVGIVAVAMSKITATGNIKWSTVLKKMAMMGAALLAVAGIMVVFALLAHKTQGLDAGNMLAFAASVTLMTIGLAAMAALMSVIPNIGGIGGKIAIIAVSAAAMAALMYVFANMLHHTEGIDPSAMVAFGAAMAIISVALLPLAAAAAVLGSLGVGTALQGAIGLIAVGAALAAVVAIIATVAGQSIANFGARMAELGSAIGMYSDMIQNADFDRIEESIGIATELFELALKIAATGVNGDLSSFVTNVTRLGAAVLLFDTLTAAADPARILSMTENISTMATTLAGIPEIPDQSNTITNIGAALKLYAGMTDGLVFNDTATTPDVQKLADMLTRLGEALPKNDMLTTVGALADDTAGQQMTDYALGLVKIAEALKQFSDSTKEINFDDVGTAIANLQKMSTLGPELESTMTMDFDLGGFLTFSATISEKKESLDQFALDVEALGGALLNFAKFVGDPQIQKDKVDLAIQNLRDLARISSLLPRTGGVFQFFMGEQDLSKFAVQMPLLGDGLKKFSASIDGITFNKTNLTSATDILAGLVEATKNIPETGGLVQLWGGEQNLNKFGEGIGELGKGLKLFSDEINAGAEFDANGIQISGARITETVLSATEVLGGIASAVAKLPETGGIGAFFTGDTDITEFAGQMKNLGIGLRQMIDGFNGLLTGEEMYASVPDFISSSVMHTNMVDKFNEEQADVASRAVEISDGLLTSVDMIQLVLDIMNNSDLILGTTLESDKFTKAFENVGSVFRDIITAINKSFRANQIPELDAGVTEHIQSISGVMDILQALANLKNSVQAFDPDEHMFSAMAEGLVNDYANFLTYAKTYSGYKMSEALRTQLSEIQEVTQIIYAMTTVKSIIGKFDPQEHLFSNMAQGLVNDYANFLKYAKKYNGYKMSDILRTQLADIKEVASVLTQMAELSTMVSGGSLSGILSGLFEDLGNGEFASPIIDGLASGISEDGISKLTQAGEKAAMSMVSAIRGKQSDFRSAGLYLAAGVVNGSAGPGAIAILKGAANKMASSILDSFKAALGIHSPSVKFIEAGQYAGEGAAIGIKQAGKGAIEEAKELGVEVVDAYGNSLEDRAKMVQWAKDNNFNYSDEFGSYDDYWKDLSGAYRKAKDESEDLAEAVSDAGDAAQEAGQDIKNAGKNAGSGGKAMAAAASSLVDYTADLTRIITALNSMDDRLEAIGTHMGEYFAFQMAGGIVQNGDPVLTAASNLADRMAEYMSLSFGDTDLFELMGLFAIMGLAHGISGNTTIAKDAMGDLSETVLKKMRDVLGIHSPSTETAKDGKNLVLGMKEGVSSAAKSESGKIADTLASVLGDQDSAFEQGFSYMNSWLDGAEQAASSKPRKPPIMYDSRTKVIASNGGSDIFSMASADDGNINLNTEAMEEMVVNVVEEKLGANLTPNKDGKFDLENMTNTLVEQMAAENGNTAAIQQMTQALTTSTGGVGKNFYESVYNGMADNPLAKMLYSIGNGRANNYLFSPENTSYLEYLDEVSKHFPYVANTEEGLTPVQVGGKIAEGLQNQLGGKGGNGAGGAGGGGGGGLNSGGAAGMAYAAQIDYSADLGRIIAELQTINDRVEIMQDTVGNLQLVLDTGALVGSTAAMFDETLGTRIGYASRGIAP